MGNRSSQGNLLESRKDCQIEKPQTIENIVFIHTDGRLACTPLTPLNYSFIHSLTRHSLTHSLTLSLTHSLTPSPHSLSFAHYLTPSLPPLTHSFTHSPHSLAHSLTHSPTHSPTHPPTHLLCEQRVLRDMHNAPRNRCTPTVQARDGCPNAQSHHRRRNSS